MKRLPTYRAIRDRLLLEFDLRIWRRRTAGLRRRSNYPAPTRKILICDLMATVAGMKAEALFAAALRSRGYTPVVLLPGRNPLAEGHFRAAGPVEFVYLDALIDDDIRRQAQQEAGDRLDADPDFAELFDWTPDGYRIGRNVLSKVVRRFRVGRLDPSDAAQRQAVRDTLAESLATKRACESLIRRITPDTALFNERGYTPAAEIFDGCLQAGVDCIQWFGAPQSDSLAYKRYRPDTRDRHPFALADATWQALQQQPWDQADDERIMSYLHGNYESGAWFNRQELQKDKVILSADAVRSQLGLDPSKKTAIIFSHILYDATFFYGTSLFADYETWLVEAVRCAIANPRLNWIVKVHPVNVWRARMDGAPMQQLEVTALERAFGKLPEHVRIVPADTNINTYALFAIADCGLTVRGTVGMELPCFGIPVVTAGTGRYSGHGFTIDPQTPEAFRRTLAALHDVQPLDVRTTNLARRYAYGSFYLRPVPMNGFVLDFAANTFALPALAGNVVFDTAAGGRLEDAPDLQRFCDWVADRNEEDLLVRDIAPGSSPTSRDTLRRSAIA